MDFEFDPNKSESNKKKHGIDFEEAQELWLDPHLLEIEANVADEPRFLLIGKIGSKYWSAIATYRGDKIGIISVRRARKEEVDLYEEN
jgi:uncharacterized DUF497 family protein